ncbi:caspase family protein [Tundrisphaera lichenicola]|uniref:caspase family protein n=1 Tax=Tundrisphaera lichenicola TaxID=2029860 RepID=UPI003EBDB9C4
MRRYTSTICAWLGLIGSLHLIGPVEAGAADARKVWAVVIGINNYADTLIPRCTGSVRDARLVADWVAGTAGWGEAGLLRMDDLGRPTHGQAKERMTDLLPTRENLDWAVTEWLGERVRPDDVVLIYFAGQSTARPPRGGAPAGRAYLLPIDARAADVDGTGWSLDDALDRGGIARKARVVIWLDSSLRGRGDRGMNLEAGSPSSLDWLRALSRWEGVTAWLAADGTRAAEDGAFVRAIREAMGQPSRAHNLIGCLDALNRDKILVDRGFRAMGGVGPTVSLWTGAARIVEQAQPELIVQSGHGDRVTSILISADNSRIISASMDSTVRVWKLGERYPAMVRVLTDPFIGVRTLAIDRDARLLLAGDGSGGIVGWDMAEDRPRPIYGPPEHEEAVASLCFLPESLRFLSLDEGGRSVLWDGTGGSIRKVRNFSDESISRIVAASRPEPGAPSVVASIVSPDGGPDFFLVFDAEGLAAARLDGPGGRITALELSDDGKRLVVGDDRGRVMVLGLPGRSVEFDRTFEGPIRLARLSKLGMLLVSDQRSLRLVETRPGGADLTMTDAEEHPVPGRIERAVFSEDGKWLAACTPIEGRILAWSLDDPARPGPVTLPDHGSIGLTPAFSPDGKALVVGQADGGIRAWVLSEAPPRATLLARVNPARGKVAALSPSPSGKFLLEITKDDLALIWDLEDGRGCKPLPGSWTSGAFLPDESKLILTNRPDRGGDLVLFDRSTGSATSTSFARPVDVAGQPSTAAFGRVVVSKSGRWAAAASHESQLPLACVWEVATGRLIHTARVHDGGLTSLDFSGDEAYLLTASEDGTAKLWPLADPATDLRSSTTFFSIDDDSPAFTVARVSPTDPQRVATGTRGGMVSLWKWEKGRARPEHQGDPFPLNGEVNALTFSPDGRWLAASASRDKSVRFWDISRVGRPRPVAFNPRVHHNEQIGALAGWPIGSMIVSGGDDAALRFWDLNDRTLQGTLIAQSRNPLTLDWLAYTPDGRFDGSMPGESMVKWRVGERIVTLQQTEDTHYAFRVAASIAGGEKPEQPTELKAEGPSLKIFAPPTEPGVTPREVELTLWTDVPRPSGLRLYQNGVPIRGEGDFEPGETPHFARTKVVLRKGENQLYAMASRPGSSDGKSEALTILYDGPEPAGRLHTLALGISNYKNRALKYAHLDASGIADFLKAQGVRNADRPGERIVLIDDQVTEPEIEKAFRRLRDAVRGHPEDTVVLFLAGHTDTDEAANQFCLLLPRFPFPVGPPAIANVVARGNGVGVRGNVGDAQGGVKVGDPQVLPYVILYNRLARLEALQRLVIVDACQAGAILDDPAVARVRKNVEWGSRKARNSYLLAARRGEPANEVDALEHGLLTYTLLRGMGADHLKPIPADLGGFPGPISADLNLDGLVSSDELVSFTDEALPRLARMFPQVVIRAGGAVGLSPTASNSPELESRLRIQSDDDSFPLVVLPK